MNRRPDSPETGHFLRARTRAPAMGVKMRADPLAEQMAVVLKDHTQDGPFAYHTLRFMDWVGNAHHGVALPYNYWPGDRWRGAFDAVGFRPEHWNSRLGLYPFPVSLIFERNLHFVARLVGR